MSNDRDNFAWDDEEDDDTIEQSTSYTNDTDLVKQLRKVDRLQKRRIKELEQNLGELTKSQRERILRDVFSSRGVNPKIAAFVPSDVEASEEGIVTWLENFGDVFGYDKPEPKVEINQSDIAAMRRMDQSVQNALAPDKTEDAAIRIANASSAEEILAILGGAYTTT